jgi:sigma-B regulation protein RsbU (phosphoserine phosphatase)
MYTDGVTEAQNLAGELYGEQRLCDILATARYEHPDLMIDRILNDVAIFSGNRPLQDDVSIVIIEVT